MERANKLGITIETMEIMPDHVHLFAKAPPTLAPHFIVQQLKGISSRLFRQEFPHLKSRLPTLWTRSHHEGRTYELPQVYRSALREIACLNSS